jgi:uncharacterized protein (TIGR02677 family)
LTSESRDRGTAAAGSAPRNAARPSNPETSRNLFRYVTAEEWQAYRQIMGIFAGTFFSEFTAEDVELRLQDQDINFPDGVAHERLESLRRWGNLTVSSTTGNPSSLSDYYRRRSRYLITRAGQEVHDTVEGILARVDEVRDVSTGRLRSLLDALRALVDADLATVDPERFADMVRAVFDPHIAFTSEITQFFASINQWANRYHLTAEEFSFFAQVLVGYVGDRLGEIEAASRPIASTLRSLADHIPLIVERARGGLAARVEEAGLSEAVVVTRSPGTVVEDWEHLRGWFLGKDLKPARLEQLGRDAVAAIRTLTLNLTRLDRIGTGASSKRGDLLALARLVAGASQPDAIKIVNVAFGLYESNHWGVVPDDADDPVPTSTSWFDAPRARVPLSLRERGDTLARGSASPLADRTVAEVSVRLQRDQQMAAVRRVDAELLAGGPLDGREVSTAALVRLEALVGRALAQMPVPAAGNSARVADGAVICTVRRAPETCTRLATVEGTLVFVGLSVDLAPM